MKILFNATVLVKGGALQATANFVREAVRADDGISWCFALSRAGMAEVEPFLLQDRRVWIEVFDDTPARNLAARRRLRQLERKLAPDAVFTLFGPAYCRFSAPHLCGVANAWVTHADFRAFSGLGFSTRLVTYPLHFLYKAFWYQWANAWVTEAEVAKRGLVRRLRIPVDRVSVVPNNCGPHYTALEEQPRFPVAGEKVRILTLSAYYPHKNLEIIPHVAREMKRHRPECDFEFITTLPEHSTGLAKLRKTAVRLDVGRHIVNVGPVPVHACPDLYRSCHLCFLPSLLETFSANYPESMAMARPLVTTDLDFSRDICGDAVSYYDPMDPKAAASSILTLLDDRLAWERLVQSGKRVLAGLPTPREKYEKYRDIAVALALGGKISHAGSVQGTAR